MSASLTQLWFLFGITNVITWIGYQTLWMTDRYPLILTILALCATSVAILVAVKSRFRFRSLSFLILGLLIGQWWWVQSFLMKTIWTLNGFAP